MQGCCTLFALVEYFVDRYAPCVSFDMCLMCLELAAHSEGALVACHAAFSFLRMQFEFRLTLAP